MIETDLPALIEELIEHGADRRNAATALRVALADLQRQAEAPDFFVAESIRAAELALIADAPRFEAALQDDAARSARRIARSCKQRRQSVTYSASCCLYYYSHTDADRSWWQSCHKCRQPLTYVRTVDPTPAAPRCDRATSDEGLTFEAVCCDRVQTYNGKTGPRRFECVACGHALSFSLAPAVAA